MSSISALSKAIVTSAALMTHSAEAAEHWFLMARHGECFPVKSLERKFPDIGNISDPEGFVRYLHGKGLKAGTEKVEVQAGKAIQVSVPAKDLYLVFVTAESCDRR